MKTTMLPRPWRMLANPLLAPATSTSAISLSATGLNVTWCSSIGLTHLRIWRIISRKLYLAFFSTATMITSWGTFPPLIRPCLSPDMISTHQRLPLLSWSVTLSLGSFV
ncbi:hypothetical protein ACHAXR_000069 [Thalassiosira sp. AJA248-18]